MKLFKQRVTIRVALGTLFVLVAAITITTAMTLQYYFSKQSELDNSLANYHAIATNTSKQLTILDRTAIGTIDKASLSIQHMSNQADNRQDLLELFTTILKHDSNIYSIYLGDQKENLFQVISLRSRESQRKISGKRGEAWLLIEHAGEDEYRVKTISYLNSNLEVTRQATEPSSLIPTQRPWFNDAQFDRVHKTEPYLFNHLNVTGQSYSKRIEGSGRVLGIDYSLSTIESYLYERVTIAGAKQPFEAYLYIDDGRLIATNQDIKIDQDLPIVQDLVLSEQDATLIRNTPSLKVSSQLDWEPIDFAVSGQPYGIAIDVLNMISQSTGLKFEYVNGLSWSELVSEYQEGHIDLLHSIASADSSFMPNTKQIQFYQLPFAFATTKDVRITSETIDSFSGKIGLLEGWTIRDKFESAFPHATFVTYPTIEIALNDLKRGKLRAVLDNAMVLNRKVSNLSLSKVKLTPIPSEVVEGSYSLILQKEHQQLYPIISKAIDNLSHDYIRQYLVNKWQKDRPIYTHVPYEQVLTLGQSASKSGSLQEIVINDENYYLFLERLATPERQVLAIIVPENEVLASVHQHIRRFLIASLLILLAIVPAAWFLAVPVARPIKQLELQAQRIAQREYKDIKLVHSRVSEIHKLSLAMLAMSKSLKAYEKEQEIFIDSFIKLIADAIDEKSPYTGGHCIRVPELASMLIEEVHQSGEAPFKHFHFQSQAERREFKVAAWLHDCGKITTPEYVVDKATKLETIYNRIHEVRTRFEVVWRDAQIEALQAQINGEESVSESKIKLEQRFQELTEQFEFVAKSNIGGEFMSDESIARIEAIAQQTWLKHFDETLGLSASELARNEQTEAPSRYQPLLSDQPSHLIKRERAYQLAPELGIKMDVPKDLYNLGEVYNLTVRKGTLTAEERFKINEHMISGIKMLNNIPFPKELQRVPQYATTHHETLKGTGYPRKLAAKDISMPERVLAICDVFEALTASDRPYKSAKTISESLDILQFMVKDNHLDGDVFKLFVEGEIYLKYAKQFLDESQIDDVDKSKYLA